jgi:hypothetical protein
MELWPGQEFPRARSIRRPLRFNSARRKQIQKLSGMFVLEDVAGFDITEPWLGKPEGHEKQRRVRR